jgi:hypothetical protein
MLVRGLSLLIALLLIASATASAQNVFRVRLDTLTVQAGDTATMNVFFTFTSTKPHNLNGFVARYLFDSNLVKIVGYSTAGTASDGLSTTESHQGIAAIGSTEINLNNQVLFRMRIVASKTLADTAWIHWDSDWPMFASESGVDSVIQTGGWLRTANATGHTSLTAPGRSVNGVITGPYADSVRFDLPIMISDISNANVTDARLQFKFDPNKLSLIAATSSKIATVVSSDVASDTASIVFQGLNGSKLLGNDTLTVLQFYALVGPDTVCTMLTNVTWQPLNSDAKRGTTDVRFDSICIYGRYQPALVESNERRRSGRLYPNPAQDHLILSDMDVRDLEVYDALGRFVGSCRYNGETWLLPPSLKAGAYRITVREHNGEAWGSTLVIER